MTDLLGFCRKVSLGFSIALNIPYIFQKIHRQGSVNVSHDFKGSHYPKDVILYAAFFYVRYAVSYRGLEKIMAERGVQVDHATLNRWVVKYLNNIVEQDHHFIKKITRPTLGFKAVHSATATRAGIEVAHMIRKQQFKSNHASPFKPEKTLRQNRRLIHRWGLAPNGLRPCWPQPNCRQQRSLPKLAMPKFRRN